MRSKRIPTIALAAALAATMASPALAVAEERATGLARAQEVTAMAIDEASERAANNRAVDPPGQAKQDGKVPPGQAKKGGTKVTGHDRAAESVAKALERGNGNGNANGRGHAADVLDKLLLGESPTTLEGANHGAKVSAMVKAYNELRRQDREDG